MIRDRISHGRWCWACSWWPPCARARTSEGCQLVPSGLVLGTTALWPRARHTLPSQLGLVGSHLNPFGPNISLPYSVANSFPSALLLPLDPGVPPPDPPPPPEPPSPRCFFDAPCCDAPGGPPLRGINNGLKTCCRSKDSSCFARR
jgi:hypothetical protein